MKYAIFDADGVPAQLVNDLTVSEVPGVAIEISDEQWLHRHELRLVDGVVITQPVQITA